jgi:hypothetical protein
MNSVVDRRYELWCCCVVDLPAGWCIFNDLAVAGKAAQRDAGISQVLMIDLDVHQGDGSATIFAGECLQHAVLRAGSSLMKGLACQLHNTVCSFGTSSVICTCAEQLVCSLKMCQAYAQLP